MAVIDEFSDKPIYLPHLAQRLGLSNPPPLFGGYGINHFVVALPWFVPFGKNKQTRIDSLNYPQVYETNIVSKNISSDWGKWFQMIWKRAKIDLIKPNLSAFNNDWHSRPVDMIFHCSIFQWKIPAIRFPSTKSCNILLSVLYFLRALASGRTKSSGWKKAADSPPPPHKGVLWMEKGPSWG